MAGLWVGVPRAVPRLGAGTGGSLFPRQGELRHEASGGDWICSCHRPGAMWVTERGDRARSGGPTEPLWWRSTRGVSAFGDKGTCGALGTRGMRGMAVLEGQEGQGCAPLGTRRGDNLWGDIGECVSVGTSGLGTPEGREDPVPQNWGDNRGQSGVQGSHTFGDRGPGLLIGGTQHSVCRPLCPPRSPGFISA